MVTDDDHQAVEATEFRRELDAMVAATADAKKKYDAACAQFLATTMLLEEQCATAVLTEAHAAVALI
jgi:hypothetical protein